MQAFNPRNVFLVTAIAVPGCAVIATLLYVLPVPFSFVGIMIGIAMFKIGHALEYKWCMACGGVLMFGSVFAWAIRQ